VHLPLENYALLVVDNTVDAICASDLKGVGCSLCLESLRQHQRKTCQGKEKISESVRYGSMRCFPMRSGAQTGHSTRKAQRIFCSSKGMGMLCRGDLTHFVVASLWDVVLHIFSPPWPIFSGRIKPSFLELPAQRSRGFQINPLSRFVNWDCLTYSSYVVYRPFAANGLFQAAWLRIDGVTRSTSLRLSRRPSRPFPLDMQQMRVC
jgi:hypothetical protein